MSLIATQCEVLEWGYTSGKIYSDPFNSINLDVVIEHASGKSWRVPAFWAGGQEWRVRFAPPLPGNYQVSTICSEVENVSLHGREATLQASPYEGQHLLKCHGSLRVAASQRSLEFSDGTPFFWLGDTWWMGLCYRLKWPDDFQKLVADRQSKGFTVIQIVAGLYPDMPAFDPRGVNEGGFPWQAEFSCINPIYFDMADLRIQWLVHSGMVPCIVGGWGYYLSVPNTINLVCREYQRSPAMPVLVGEANYEGILQNNEAAVQRLTFWSAILSGACGHTYGANGLWQLNTHNKPYGASPWGGTWGGPAWEDASQLPGSDQLGMAKRLLMHYKWWRFETHPEWVEPSGSADNVDFPFAAGIPGEVRMVYFYWPTFQEPNRQYKIRYLEPGLHYKAYFWNPRNGQEFSLGEVKQGDDNTWNIPIQPELKDWVVVLERLDES